MPIPRDRPFAGEGGHTGVPGPWLGFAGDLKVQVRSGNGDPSHLKDFRAKQPTKSAVPPLSFFSFHPGQLQITSCYNNSPTPLLETIL